MFQGIKLLNFNQATMKVTNLKGKRVQAKTNAINSIIQAVAEQKNVITRRNNAMKQEPLVPQQTLVVEKESESIVEPEEEHVVQQSIPMIPGFVSLASHLNRINQPL